MKELMLIAHFLGLAMGVGTSLAFMFLGIASSKMEEKEGIKFRLNTFALSRMGHIGLALLVISGLYLMTPYWSVLSSTPLLIAKLVLVLLLGSLVGMISSKARRAKMGNPEMHLKQIAPLGMISLFTGLAIITLAVLIFG